MKMYSELAPWWPLLSAPADYAEEALSFLGMIDRGRGERPTLLELGAGGGNLASHLKAHVQATLSDLSADMIEVSRALNPELEHVQGDMRTLRLGRRFDVVLIHDAVMYCITEKDLRDALVTAATHCRPGGQVIVAPDSVRESYAPETSWGGEDGTDGRALRYLEWSFDPDPDDDTTDVVYTIVMREANGELRTVTDRHVEGNFSEQTFRAAFDAAGLEVRIVHDAWKRHVFVARNPESAT